MKFEIGKKILNVKMNHRIQEKKCQMGPRDDLDCGVQRIRILEGEILGLER